MVVSTPQCMYAIFVNETVDRPNNASPRWSTDPKTRVRDLCNEMVVSTPQRMHAIFDITKRSYRPNYAYTRLQLKLIMSIEFTQVYRLVSCRLITLVRDFHKKLSSNVHKFTGLFHVDPIMHVRKKLSCRSNAHEFTGLRHVDLKTRVRDISN